MSPAGRYRRIRSRLWVDPSFVKLAGGERLVVFYLLSGPHTNSLGLYRLSAAAAAEDLGIPVGMFRRRFDSVLRAFGWRYEQHTRVLWIPEWANENAPQNPNIVQAWRSAFDEIPEGPLKAEAGVAILAFLNAKGPAFGKAFGEPMVEPVRNDLPNTPDPDPDRANRIANHDARRIANAANTRTVVDQLQRRRSFA
jgi:hypothetical protein